mgnify:CR=1 FL=1
MEEKQSIIAAGAGASTKIVLRDPIPMPGSKKKKMTRLIRQENVKAVDAYIDRIDEMIAKENGYGIKEETGYRYERHAPT